MNQFKKLSHTLWQSQHHIIWHSSILSTTGIHPLASNNQILLVERDFRGCGFSSARLELSTMWNAAFAASFLEKFWAF